MGDRIRGGLFNVLGDIENLDVLDVYSGSGALAFEAISRGAKSAVTIEAETNAQKAILQNTKLLGLDHRIKSTQAFFASWSKRNSEEHFDIVFADPPYDAILDKDMRLLPLHLKVGGVLILSWPGRRVAIELAGLDIIRSKKYGDAQLVFYKKVS